MSKAPRRVLHVLGRMDRGGAETVTMNAYRKMDRTEVQFDFAVNTSQEGYYDAEIGELGGRVIRHPEPATLGLQGYGARFQQTLVEYGPYWVVHSHVHFFSGYILKLAHEKGVPVRVAHSHCIDDGKPATPIRRCYRLYMKHLIRQHGTVLLGCSQAACRALFGSDIGSKVNVRVLPNAIDLNLYDSLSADRSGLRTELDLPLEAVLIGNVGRFAAQKNHFRLIEIFQCLRRTLPTAHLVLVGDGELRNVIEARIRENSLRDCVHLLGVRGDVHRVLRVLNAFVFPSLSEGLPIAVIEAQAAGIPCIASTAVPDEADLGVGLLSRVSLAAGNERWSAAIAESLCHTRVAWKTIKWALVNGSFDINTYTAMLQQSYEPKCPAIVAAEQGSPMNLACQLETKDMR